MAGGHDSRVVLGTALQAAARFATAFLAFLIVALLARVLDKDAFGRYSATIALFQVLDVLVDCGSLQAAVRLVARDPATAGAAVRAAVRFRLATATIALLVSTGLAWAQGDPQVLWVAAASLAFFTHAAGMGVAVLHADIDYSRSESLRIVGSLLGLLATVGLVAFGFRDAGSMLVAIYAASAAANLLLAFSVRSDVPAVERPIDGRDFRREAVSLGIGGVIRQAYYSANPVLARGIGGDLAGARFAPAYRLTGFSILFSVYFGAASLPALVRLRAEDPAAYRRFARRWTALLAILGIGIGASMYALRRPLLRILFGEEYVDTESVLAPMCLTAAIIYIGGFALTRLIAAGRDRVAMAISGAGLAVNLITNFILIPRYGAEGAAWTSVVTESTVAAGAYAALALDPNIPSLRP